MAATPQSAIFGIVRSITSLVMRKGISTSARNMVPAGWLCPADGCMIERSREACSDGLPAD